MDQDGIRNLFSSISYKNSATGAQLGVSLEKGHNLKRNQMVVEPSLLAYVEGWWLLQISEMTNRRIGGVGFTLLDMERVLAEVCFVVLRHRELKLPKPSQAGLAAPL